MKRYRLHDLLRAAAVAWAVTACSSEPGSSGSGADTSAADTASADTGATDTSGTGDSAQADTGATDTAGNDTTAADTTTTDTAVTDTVVTDTSTTDTTVTDTTATDTTVTDVAADITVPDTTTTDATTDATTDTASNDTGGTDAKPTDTGNAAAPFPCKNPKAIVIGGVDTGVDECDNGSMRRREVVACPAYVPDPNSKCPLSGGTPGTGCQTDNDCVGQGDGPCLPGVGTPWCFCQSTCKTDADCGTGQVCLCGPKYGTCMAATCNSSHDCPVGDCVTHDTNPGCGGKALACQTDVDECGGPADCPTDKPFCAIDKGETQGKHVCAPYMCAIGRPFEVAGAWRTAEPEARADWNDAGADATVQTLAAVFEALGADERAALREHWLQAAQMEHASVASFARLTLELMAVGAPPELLVRAQQAGIDEVRHAERCFAVAEALGAGPRGPGALPIDGSLRAPTLVEIAAAAAREGCVWETAAALQAQVEAERCGHPALKAVLAEIAADEARHAELAWDLVAWAVRVGGEPVRAAVVAAMDEATAALREPVAAPALPEGFGSIGGAALSALRAHAAVAVVEPARARYDLLAS